MQPDSVQSRPERLAAVFGALRTSRGMKASDLAKQLGLSRPTVVTLLTDLERSAVAVAMHTDVGSSGRPATVWGLAPKAGYVIGADLLNRSLLISAATLDGRVAAAVFHPVPASVRQRRFETVVEHLKSFISECAGLGPLRAVSVSCTGTIDQNGTVSHSTLVPQWDNFPIGAELSEALGQRVRVENDVNCSALGEYIERCATGQLTSADDLVFIQLAGSMVTGLILGGEIHRGISCNAGEFGLPLVDNDDLTDEELVRQVSRSIQATSAVLDPSVIVVSSPLLNHQLVPAVRRFLATHFGEPAPNRVMERPLLGERAACVGALTLALTDAALGLVGAPAPSVCCPTNLDLLGGTLGDRSHTASLEKPPSQRVPLRVGVVGVGARSSIIRHALVKENNAVLAAACDPFPGTRQRLQDWTRVDTSGVTIVTGLEEFIRVGLDAAFVMSPDDTHADVTCTLLEAGIPVYLEKPIAIELADATRILETAYRTGTKLYVGHNMRHMNVVRTLRDLIGQGVIGEVKAIWCRHFVGHGGDFYFKDWHADRRHSKGLLLQKAAHDLDVMNWLAGTHATRVVAMGGLSVYGQIEDRRDRGGELMPSWFSLENWPPGSQTGLNPVVDVEDISMLLAETKSGVFLSYQQCHFTPDYWRNYTVIGTEGRLENFGDTQGGHVTLWNRRSEYDPDGDARFPILGDAGGHDDADLLTVTEFLNFVRVGGHTDTSPLDAWHAVATAVLATDSLRSGAIPQDIPELPVEITTYFHNNQTQPGKE